MTDPLVHAAKTTVAADFEASLETLEIARVRHFDEGYAGVAVRFHDTSARPCRAITVLESTGEGWTATGAGSSWRGSAQDVWWYPVAMATRQAILLGIWIDVPSAESVRIVAGDGPPEVDALEGGVALVHFETRPGPSTIVEVAGADGDLLVRGELWRPPRRLLNKAPCRRSG